MLNRPPAASNPERADSERQVARPEEIANETTGMALHDELRAWKVLTLNPGTAALIATIREEIRRSGPISFARFMEHALYHPEHGYYSSGRAAPGRHGDYFTNVSVGPAFGQMFAWQFVEIWKNMGAESDFALVEQGAHHGDLARDFLQALREEAPALFAVLRYEIVEPSRRLQDRQRKTLAEFHDKVGWHESLDALKPFDGVHFSNELFDALPFHLISAGGAIASPWMERCVAIDGDEFVLTEQPMADSALLAQAAKLPLRPAGYQTEINLAALQLMRDLSPKVRRGYVITVDYGFSRTRFYEEERRTGTMQIRAQHRLLESPFEGIGQSDITAHVEWTSLVEEAEAFGLALGGFTDQHHFLTGILAAFPEFAKNASPQTRRAWQTLLHPEMLGRSFQVLALSKGMDGSPPLRGFKFARDPRAALELR